VLPGKRRHQLAQNQPQGIQISSIVLFAQLHGPLCGTPCEGFRRFRRNISATMHYFDDGSLKSLIVTYVYDPVAMSAGAREESRAFIAACCAWGRSVKVKL
jgi:hypothetical protein